MRQLIVTAAVLDEAGRVLLGQRTPDVRYGGLWEFPGGKVHDSETCDDAITRELAEEVGLDVQTACLAPLSFVTETSQDSEFLILLYIVRIWEGRASVQEGRTIQ
ncbi:MAG: NUDIX domain-containing protein, partial [Alphaproteobacteria bacterium]|nr:NUDIX domain-containing protein [Alphaproteobacteria bacterium]